MGPRKHSNTGTVQVYGVLARVGREQRWLGRVFHFIWSTFRVAYTPTMLYKSVFRSMCFSAFGVRLEPSTHLQCFEYVFPSEVLPRRVVSIP